MGNARILDQRVSELSRQIPRQGVIWNIYELRDKGRERDWKDVLSNVVVGRLLLYRPYMAMPNLQATVKTLDDGFPIRPLEPARIGRFEHNRLMIHGIQRAEGREYQQAWCCVVREVVEFPKPRC